MIVFEFTESNKSRYNNGLRVLVIGETYRAYENQDGSVHLNDEKAGHTFNPSESYENFRGKFTIL